MNLFGTVKYYFKQNDLIAAHSFVKVSQNNVPYIIALNSSNEKMCLYFTSSLAKELKEGMEVTDIGLKSCVMWEKVTKEGDTIFRIGRMKSLNEYEPYEQLLKNSSNLNYVEKLRAFEWRDKREKIIERENSLCETCKDECIVDLETYFSKYDNLGKDLKLKWANVHHTYYVKDSLPWHYPDESLKLLCMGCHQELHNNIKIRAYKDYTFTTEIDLIKCIRCVGTGYLPEYHYFHNGVCFSCNGTGFENLK